MDEGQNREETRSTRISRRKWKKKTAVAVGIKGTGGSREENRLR